MPGYNWFKSKLELKVENIDCLKHRKNSGVRVTIVF